MKKDIEDLKKELVAEIKNLASEIASSNSYVGLLANETKFRSLQEKFINLKFLERKQIGSEIFECFEYPNNTEEKEVQINPIENQISEYEEEVYALHQPNDKINFVENEKNKTSIQPISLDFNDQLAFQHQLFNGDAESMKMVVGTLNAIHSLSDSKKYLTDLQKEMQWQDKGEYVERLEELIIKRFD